MEITGVLFFVFVTVALTWLCCRNEVAGPWGCIFLGILALILWLAYIPMNHENFSDIQPGVVYTLAYEYKGADTELATRVLSLQSPWWNRAYIYRLYCSDLRDGCPEKWPKRFTLLEDDSVYKLVELTEKTAG